MSNETQQEQWNATHAQLLKSVADAQGKLLAAQNETNDRLAAQAKEITGLNETLHRIRDRLDTLDGRLADASLMKDGLFSYRREMMAKVDAIGAQLAALLAPPRRQVERLRTKRILKQQRKQRR